MTRANLNEQEYVVRSFADRWRQKPRGKYTSAGERRRSVLSVD